MDHNSGYTNRKNVKNRSSDYIYGLVECYLMAIEVLCNIDGIAGGVVCFVQKYFFVAEGAKWEAYGC